MLSIDSLMKTKSETAIFEFNIEIFKTYNKMLIWAERCIKHANILYLNGQELMILNVLGIEGSASLYQIKVITDNSHNVNINYIIKKLLKMKLIKSEVLKNCKRSIHYQISEEGNNYLTSYISIRSKMIKKMFSSSQIENLVKFTQNLRQIRGCYINSIEAFSDLKEEI